MWTLTVTVDEHGQVNLDLGGMPMVIFAGVADLLRHLSEVQQQSAVNPANHPQKPKLEKVGAIPGLRQ